jgi:hypothetical protein
MAAMTQASRPKVSGSDYVRLRLKTSRLFTIADLVRDHKIATISELEAFQNKGVPLPDVADMKKLTKLLVTDSVTWDEATDSIVSTAPLATPMCGTNYPPAPYVPPAGHKVERVAHGFAPDPKQKHPPSGLRPAQWPPRYG